MSDLPRLPQTPMLDRSGKPFYPLTQYNQIVMPGGERWDGNPGSSVELDATLKEPGKAADAKATGDALDELKNEKANQTGWTANKSLGTDASGNMVVKDAYSLPTASASVLGGVKVGNGLTIDVNGVLSLALDDGDEVSY